MSICRGISTDICNPISRSIFRGAGSETETTLDPFVLLDVTFTLPALLLSAGDSVSPDFLTYLQGLSDSDFPDFQQWSELGLESATGVLQHFSQMTVESREDIINSDLNSGFGGSRTWRGEVDTQSDITGNLQGVWFVRDTTDVDDGGSILWGFASNLSPGTGLAATFNTGSWLGAETLSSLETHFGLNTYNMNTRYYYYDTVLRAVRRYVRTSSEVWADFVSGDEIQGVAFSELMASVTNLLAQGRAEVSLAASAIDADVSDVFRFRGTLSNSDGTVYLNQPLNLMAVDTPVSMLRQFRAIQIGTKRILIGGHAVGHSTS